VAGGLSRAEQAGRQRMVIQGTDDHGGQFQGAHEERGVA
jgi:hypothetical protein